MTTTLADFVQARSRFSRSANVERDHGPRAVEGYIPTGRAIDVISRIARGLSDPAAGRTFSLTGPHGGGKSSLAVFLDGLLSGSSTHEHRSAHRILGSADSAVEIALKQAVKSVGASRSGFVRAFRTAQREPIAVTIARALYSAAVRDFGEDQDMVPEKFATATPTPSNGDVRQCVERICSTRPLTIVVDEFGKSLEYYASSGNEGDPFLLQGLAEMTQGEQALPLVILTMQHLSFEEYLQQDSSMRRREWVKVQGRFQDIPFVESPSEARRLIAASLERTSREIGVAASDWVSQHRKALESLGLRDLANDAEDAVPLHPLALAVLPDLCSRYGQNERTLFSFLAGSEPNAVPAYLERTQWAPSEPLPLVGLDLLYDYFLESSGSMISVADNASRWIEIETRIRDSAGLGSAELRAIKAIGVLNLVSAGGRIRASRAMLDFALAGGPNADATPNVGDVLASLVDSGLVVYRSFSDEYRIWQGSDYDLRRVIDGARRECEQTDLAELLNKAASLEPAVASRHSQQTGVLRVFSQKFGSSADIEDKASGQTWDGAVLYSTTPDIDTTRREQTPGNRPVVAIVPEDLSSVHAAAIEAGALQSALRTAEEEGADWVARRELIERTAAAQQSLNIVIGQTWNSGAHWELVGTKAVLGPDQGLSSVLSDVADLVYTQTPRVANEMIARRELTSQGAKARRFLVEAMLSHTATESFGISGYGPDKAIYEAIFRTPGIHRTDDAGVWGLHPPADKRWQPVWRAINDSFDDAVKSRMNLLEALARLTAAPFGLKDGLIPVLLIAALVVRKDDIALYEHGSLVLSIDDAVAERLTRNPGHFAVRNTQAQSGARKAVIDALVARFGISDGREQLTFLKVATALFRELRLLPPYAQKARRPLRPETIAVRDAFHTASEPDVLIFETLPAILGFRSFTAGRRITRSDVERYASRLAEAFVELHGVYPGLLADIQHRLAQATSMGGALTDLRDELARQAASLEGRVLEPRLKAFVGALTRPTDDEAWLENVAMVVAEGHSPRVWTDDIAAHFPLKVAEVGGALRRTLALLYDRLASGSDESFSVSRMTLTRPDGSESIEMLAITEQQKAAIDEHFEPFLDRLTELWGSRSAARRMLMARLAAEHGVTGAFVLALDTDREQAQYG
jgi:hypothetical protein